jgi:FtsP/CotA-like multicopper oxidase with cupredoxin domain
MGSW